MRGPADAGAQRLTGETTMTTDIVLPATVAATATSMALLAALAGATRLPLWRRLADRVREEWHYFRALRELNRLDQRDLDDLALGRADLPELARTHARNQLAR